MRVAGAFSLELVTMLRLGMVIAFGIVLGATGCSGGNGGPRKYPVAGRFVINGVPAEQVAVTFHHSDGDKAGENRYAAAVTDKDGRFELSTTGDKDGAIEGEYRVTFAWLSSKELDAFDMLSGAFGDPATTTLRATVPGSGPELPPFELAIPENRIRRSKRP